ncbi:hypothetical protein [Paenirhodobacter populi]|uniref:Uncharacterized protein n=1 Tax=Paenirhodobacter populi TaxID=2306993 RepID=A0A443J0V7_9RHOB|nr:hypothetical protein [Sinirhodobacter populi]RWR14251.1 hypothetical protein D2T33_03265 [Sinirhodobacter populi]
MSDSVVVTLTGPAKVAGRWKKPGDQVRVDETLVSQLPVDPGAVHVSTMSSAEAIDAAVAEKLDAAVKGATRDLEAALVEKISLLSASEGRRELLQARVAELEAQLAVATGPQLASGKDVADTEAAKVTKATSGKETKG